MLRVGLGFDAHRFAANRRLVLGGVEIPNNRGLLGHSDADVLLHALADALLGAAGMGDLGSLFPDSDPAWKNASSTFFIHQIMQTLEKDGWSLINADMIVMAQVPKITPHRQKMRASVASLLKVGEERISIKATTTDQMGFTGRKEGIAAQAVVLLQKGTDAS